MTFAVWGIAKPTIPSLSWYQSTPSVRTSPFGVERNHSIAVYTRNLLDIIIVLRFRGNLEDDFEGVPVDE